MNSRPVWRLRSPGDSVREFLQTIVDAGGHLWVCKMSADMMHIDEKDLFDGVEGIIGATEFIEMSEGAQIIFV